MRFEQKAAWLLVSVSLAARDGQPIEAADFEVASVKRNLSGETRVRFEMPPGNLNAVNVPLRFAIRQAYRVPEARVVGGPAWLDTERYDIAAKAPSAMANPDSLRMMLRSLLSDRFGVVVHAESRDVPVYVLRVARSDRKLGPNLRESSTDCTWRPAAMAGNRVQCGILVSQAPTGASLRGGGTTIAEFTRLLGDFVDRPLVDETGLKGKYDLDLEFAALKSALPGERVPGGLGPGSPNELPAVFTAIQEQLGLKLEAQRRVTEVYVVDRARRPGEN